jgi:uroporphyrinogen-III synthase
LHCRLKDPSKQKVIALGEATAGAAEELGFTVSGVLDLPKPEYLAEYLKQLCSK